MDHDSKVIKTTIDIRVPDLQKKRYVSYAKEFLTGRLQSIAEKHAIVYKKIIIRNQKTKW